MHDLGNMMFWGKQTSHGKLIMMVVSENEHTEDTIKAELEELYLAAGYIHAERGNMNIAMILIGAAIAELECILEERRKPVIRLIHDADKLCSDA